VRSGSERGSDSRDRDTAFGSAQEGDKTYRAALGSGKAGESTRFVLTGGRAEGQRRWLIDCRSGASTLHRG